MSKCLHCGKILSEPFVLNDEDANREFEIHLTECPAKEELINGKFEKAINDNKINVLPKWIVEGFIERNFDLWACKFELSPCGHLSITGKRDYIKNNILTIRKLIEFNKENPTEQMREWKEGDKKNGDV